MAGLEDKQTHPEAYLRAAFASETQITVTNAATLLSTLIAAGAGSTTVKQHRQTVVFTNNGANDIYIAFTSSIGTTRYLKKMVSGSDPFPMQIGSNLDPYLIAPAGNTLCEVTQLV